MNYVLYHKNCTDGLGAAFCAYLALGDAAKYLPVQYGDPIPEPEDEWNSYYILDFSFPRAELLALEANPKVVQVVVLDHHKSAMENLMWLPPVTPDGTGLQVQFDMTRCGAELAWAYFHPGQRQPPLIDYIRDRDLWQWALEKSREISAGLRVTLTSCPDPLKLMQEMVRHWSDHWRERLVSQGEVVTLMNNSMVKAAVKRARFRTEPWDNLRYAVTNSAVLQSETGEALLERYPEISFAVIWYFDGEKFVVSLRSRNCAYDVAKLASRYGGGGHRSAAGYTDTEGSSVLLPVEFSESTNDE